jgi:hypothetical protein
VRRLLLLFRRKRCRECQTWRRLYLAERRRVEYLTDTYLARFGVQSKPFEVEEKGKIEQIRDVYDPIEWEREDIEAEIEEKAQAAADDDYVMQLAEEASLDDPLWRRIVDRARAIAGH